MISSYKELTLDKYLQLRQIDYEGKEDIDIQVEIISILNDMDIDSVLGLPLADYQRLALASSFLSKEPVVGSNPPKTIKIGDRVYTVVRDVRDFTTGQFIDYQSYIKGDLEQNLKSLCTVFVIPKGKKYGDGYDIADTLSDMGQIPIETVLCLSRFFFRKSLSSIRSTVTSLDWMMRRMERKEKDKEAKARIAEARKGLHTLSDSLKGGDGLVM